MEKTVTVVHFQGRSRAEASAHSAQVIHNNGSPHALGFATWPPFFGYYCTYYLPFLVYIVQQTRN